MIDLVVAVLISVIIFVMIFVALIGQLRICKSIRDIQKKGGK